MLNFSFEQDIYKKGYKIVGGIDEVGRGPLAGPVVAACVVVGKDSVFDKKKFSLIRDSKKIIEKRRKELSIIIKEEFIFGIGVVDSSMIDSINILQASFLAMKKAVTDLRVKPDFVFVDGKLLIPNFPVIQKSIIQGDDLVFSVAAASILAKVTRDEIMYKMDKEYPLYGFLRNKGYGTKEHLKAINKYGPCAIHRKSFAPMKNF